MMRATPRDYRATIVLEIFSSFYDSPAAGYTYYNIHTHIYLYIYDIVIMRVHDDRRTWLSTRRTLRSSFFNYIVVVVPRAGMASPLFVVVHVALYYYTLYYMNGTRNNTTIISSSLSLGHLSVGFFSSLLIHTANSCCITQTANNTTYIYTLHLHNII